MQPTENKEFASKIPVGVYPASEHFRGIEAGNRRLPQSQPLSPSVPSPCFKKWAARVTPRRRPSLGCLEGSATLRKLYSFHKSIGNVPGPQSLPYCNSLVTSCCTVLACASAAMPVWLRISYFDIFDVAEA